MVRRRAAALVLGLLHAANPFVLPGPRVAAQREDSSDLAPEHPTRITPRNRSSTGSLRSAPRTSTGSGDHLARFETGDY